MSDDEPPQTRWWWTCSNPGCSVGGSGTSPEDRDENKAVHEMVCPKGK